MKINSDLTKTLLEIAAKTTLDKIAHRAGNASRTTPQDSAKVAGTDADTEQTDEQAETGQKNAPDSQRHEPSAHVFKSIGTQVAAAVTDGLSRHMDRKVEEIVKVVELAVERQRVVALSDMQAKLAVERTKAMEDLQKTAASISHKIIMSAAFIGVSLLVVAAALFFHK
jgi:hypothetical protein